MNRSLRNLLNFALFQVGWFACVAGAGRGYPWLGPIAVAAILAIHLALATERRSEAAMIAAVGTLGAAVESIAVAARVYIPNAPPLLGIFCPLYLVALWYLFASLLNASLGWLRGRYVLAAAFGAIGGPLSYSAGVRLGAIRFNDDRAYSIVAMSLLWGVMTPVIVTIAARMCGKDAGPSGALSQ